MKHRVTVAAPGPGTVGRELVLLGWAWPSPPSCYRDRCWSRCIRKQLCRALGGLLGTPGCPPLSLGPALHGRFHHRHSWGSLRPCPHVSGTPVASGPSTMPAVQAALTAVC